VAEWKQKVERLKEDAAPDSPAGWAFTCHAQPGATPCGFRSSGWRTKRLAELRAAQHDAEHQDHRVMQDVNEFMAEHDANA